MGSLPILKSTGDLDMERVLRSEFDAVVSTPQESKSAMQSCGHHQSFTNPDNVVHSFAEGRILLILESRLPYTNT